MVVALLLTVIWAAVLVPPAVRSHNARRKAFEVSFGRAVAPVAEQSPAVPATASDRRHSPPVQRRRRIAGGLLVAMIASGLAGLLPSFRVLLVVNLFVDDSFLFYVALLAYQADRRTGTTRESTSGRRASARATRRPAVPRSGVLADLPSVAGVG